MPAPLRFLSSDARILHLIREGKEEALVALFEQNRKPVSAFVLRNSGSPDDADDILQEALVILWERVRSGRFEAAAKLSTFVYATARNLWLRVLARRRREIPGDPPEPEADPLENPLDRLVTEEESSVLRSAMEKLSEQCRQLLLLYYWEELSMEDIALQLGFANAATAKSKKYQCKEALKRLLKELAYEH